MWVSSLDRWKTSHSRKYRAGHAALHAHLAVFVLHKARVRAFQGSQARRARRVSLDSLGQTARPVRAIARSATMGSVALAHV